MWDKVRQWLADNPPPQLPEDEGLFDDLTAVNKKYDYRGRLQLEEKDAVKKRIGRSPDKADALALTFAEPVFDDGEPKLYRAGRVSMEEMFESQLSRRNNTW